MFKDFGKNFKNYFDYLMTVNFKELFINVVILFCIIVLAAFVFVPVGIIQDLVRSMVTLFYSFSVTGDKLFNIVFLLISTIGFFLAFIYLFNKRFSDIEAFKKQSETIFVELNKLLKKVNLDYKDIDRVIITDGPGSYTGVRIAMTFAKVLGSICNKEVYTLSTLQLYAGKKECMVLLDARANRCYFAKYKDGQPIIKDCIKTNDEIREMLDSDCIIKGDLHLFNREDNYQDIVNNFIDCHCFFYLILVR